MVEIGHTAMCEQTPVKQLGYGTTTGRRLVARGELEDHDRDLPAVSRPLVLGELR